MVRTPELTLRDGKEVAFLPTGGPRWVVFYRPSVVLLFVHRSWLQSGESAYQMVQEKLKLLRGMKPRRPVEWVPVWPYRIKVVVARKLWPSEFGWDDLESAREYTRRRRREKRTKHLR
jgi:hypothetical protein